ncbi:MAG: hypothetical protein H6551_06535 [Chitinophagales bacterium]|nr:hypothetical protein [Chitinophagales bacterium]
MLSRLTYAFSVIVLFVTSFILHPTWDKEGDKATIVWDVAGYYWYLPTTFIYHDLKEQKFKDSLSNIYSAADGMVAYKDTVTGHAVNKYSSGMAILYSPLFFAAHMVAPIIGYPADGFSKPYQFAIQFGSLLISFLGLWYYRKFLLYYYSDTVTAIMLLLIVIGTNYLTYSALNGAYTHNWLFTIYVLLLLATKRFYEHPNIKHATYVGLLIGIAILVRPTEVVAFLIPMLWGMENISLSSFKNRFQFFVNHYKHILVTIVCATLVFGIQIGYWLYVTGEPFVYSYQDQGFSFASPHTYNYMFSYKSGWLMYTPLLFFSFIGVIPFIRHGKNKVMILFFFAIFLYITSAWDIWWYAGTGGRAMIQSYPIILIPFATLIEWLASRKFIKWLAFTIILLFSYINIWFTYSAHAKDGLYNPEAMTGAYYWHVIGRFKVPQYYERYMDTDEYFGGVPEDMKVIYTNDFEQDTTESREHVINGNVSMYFDKNREYGPVMTIPYNNDDDADWIRAQIKTHPLNIEWTRWKMLSYIVYFKNTKENKTVKERSIKLNSISKPFNTSDVYFDVKIPGEDFDRIEVLIWNPASEVPIILDDIVLYSFKE